MALTTTWRLFRRMQHTLLAVAALTYAGVAVEAWGVAHVSQGLKLARMAIYPGVALVISAALMLGVRPLARALVRHLWTSYRTGFGQSVISVLVGVGVLIGLAGFIVWQIHGAARGGGYPAGAFTGYGAGIGLLLAQAVLIRRMERDPGFRPLIEG